MERRLGGSNADTMRRSNRQAVLQVIRLRAPVSRAEIARHTGLTAAAVTNIVNSLLAAGLVVETGRRTQGRGQPPVELDLAADGALSVGLHLDRDLLSGVAVDLKGQSVKTIRRELDPPGPEEAVALLSELFEDLVTAAGVDRSRLLGAGVVTVGPLDLETGTVRGPPNFAGWHEVPLRERLEKALGLPVILENNATAAAIGEHWYGVGRGLANFLYIYIGLGVGGGLFFENRVYRGSGLNAGEFGYMLVRSGGEAVPVESLTSILALRRDLGESYRDPKLIGDAFGTGDPGLLAWLKRAGQVLAEAVAGLDNVLDLDAVIVGGRHQPEVIEYLTAVIREGAEPLLMPHRPRSATVLAGRTGEDTAALGAATLPLYYQFADWRQSPEGQVGREDEPAVPPA